MHAVIVFLFATSAALAATLEAVPSNYQFKDIPEYQAIIAVLKSHGEFKEKVIESTTPPTPKTKSRGELMVEEAKARNRAILAKQNEAEKKAQEDQTQLTGPALWKEEMRKTREKWDQDVLEHRKQWQREQDIFYGRIKVYQENTFEIPVPKEKIIEKKVLKSNLPEAHVVNATFNVPIRDQLGRPTCSAFAGIRVMEILLSQNKRDKDLSEQYMYWASKPSCHSKPCAEKGSWITRGYKFSQKHAMVDIPSESDCSYKTENVPMNETQIPLSSSCTQGMTKVRNFVEVKSLAEVVEKIKKDIPVVMAAKLSENFYRNQGLVSLTDAQKNTGKKLDAHSLGHAFVGVGILELPENLHKSEGSYCIIVANSWGKGWGAGGYSCLTENWLLKYRQPAAFIAVTALEVK